jgi:hypothetical protein
VFVLLRRDRGRPGREALPRDRIDAGPRVPIGVHQTPETGAAQHQQIREATVLGAMPSRKAMAL